MTRPIVAIVGRPNVGKSTFFNRLIGERHAIVEEHPGTTRDRLYGTTEWNGREFNIVDTAGITDAGLETNPSQAEIIRATHAHVLIAIEEADVILFMVDGKVGLTSDDAEIAEMLRRTNKPVILGVNKADSHVRELNAVEFYALNIGNPIPMSAYHGGGNGDVLDRVVEALPPADVQADDEERIRIAIVGRPNVGKSSLLNTMIGQERSVVSTVPGTTRDSIDTEFVYEQTHFTLIDTAGVRRAGRIERGVEQYSVLRTLRAIERCDVALLLIDAVEGITAQDTHIAGMILEASKSVMLLLNKWDAVDKDAFTFDALTPRVKEAFKFMDYAPILSISALSGQRVHKIVPLVMQIAEERNKRVSTGKLNELLRNAVLKHPPTSVKKGAHLRIYFATQPQVAPPVFLFFTNDKDMVHWSYGRYLENCIREQYTFMGTPIKIVFRNREEKQAEK